VALKRQLPRGRGRTLHQYSSAPDHA